MGWDSWSGSFTFDVYHVVHFHLTPVNRNIRLVIINFTDKMYLHFSVIFGENYYTLHVQYFTCTISDIMSNECFGFTGLLLIGPTSIAAFVY